MGAILITGGAGFMGSHFVKHMLAAEPGTKVICFDKLTYAGNRDNLKELAGNLDFSFVQGDIQNSELIEHIIKTQDVRRIVNFAAETHVDRSIDSAMAFEKTNVGGTLVLLEQARKFDVEMLHVSTDEVYGSIERGSFTEESILDPRSPYSASKAAADNFALAYAKTYGLKVKITRSVNYYGSNQYPEKLIPLAITNVLEGKKIPVYGSGKNVRDWIFTKDVCSAINFVMRNGKSGEIYNISSRNELTNIEVVRKILSILGKDDLWFEYVSDRPGHDLRYSVDARKLTELGWQPKVSFEDGLRQTVEWYRTNEWWWKPLKEKMSPIRWLSGDGQQRHN